MEVVTPSPSIKELPDNVFDNCKVLYRVRPDIDIAMHIEKIGDSAFFDCKNISDVFVENITSQAKEIGYGAFSGCDSLTKVTLGDNVEKIGSRAFAKCGSLETVEFPSSVKEYGYEMFEDCTALKNAFLPDGATIIRNGFYRGNSAMTDTYIPDSVETIEDYAYKGCSSLGRVTIPDSVTKISDHAFEGCPGVIICGSLNSEAHNYAIRNNISFATVLSKIAKNSSMLLFPVIQGLSELEHLAKIQTLLN